jgi:nucleotide-binding universal stress UspA family protein
VGVLETIVVGTDGSDTAAKAVEEAAQLAGATGAVLHIVTAFEPLRGDRFSPDAQADSVLDAACGAARIAGAEPKPHAQRGDPAEAILTVAEQEGADLIAVGSKGMRGGRRFLLGSVPNKVSHHASCSVLIVRTT